MLAATHINHSQLDAAATSAAAATAATTAAAATAAAVTALTPDRVAVHHSNWTSLK